MAKVAPTKAAQLIAQWDEKILKARGAKYGVAIDLDFAKECRQELVLLDATDRTKTAQIFTLESRVAALEEILKKKAEGEGA